MPIYGGFGAGSLSEGEYDPGDINEIDKKIRHLPLVVAKLRQKAQEALEMTLSDNMKVVVQNDPDTQRPRAYVTPANRMGVHEELSESLLQKAAFAMEGR